MSDSAAMESDALFRYALRLGDLSLVLAQRLGEWVGHAPALEEDLGSRTWRSTCWGRRDCC
jgi:1,2-phenylacetyl-CoA epoxidase catalytic subunit